MKSIENVRRSFGKPIDIGELAFTTVANMIAGMFWGRTLEPGLAMIRLGREFRPAAFRITKILGRPNVSDFFPLLANFDLCGGGEGHEGRSILIWDPHVQIFWSNSKGELGQFHEQNYWVRALYLSFTRTSQPSNMRLLGLESGPLTDSTALTGSQDLNPACFVPP